jgi:hypothetical protein
MSVICSPDDKSILNVRLLCKLQTGQDLHHGAENKAQNKEYTL